MSIISHYPTPRDPQAEPICNDVCMNHDCGEFTWLVCDVCDLSTCEDHSTKDGVYRVCDTCKAIMAGGAK